jgi:cell wall assembly regulator SMI1
MIAESWRRIENWLRAHDPGTLATLRPGATPEALAATEAALGVALPDDLRASILLHDGQERSTTTQALPALIEGVEFLSLDEMRVQWAIWQELLADGEFDRVTSDASAGVRPDWWNARWIPLTYDGSGNHYCADLDPAPGGTAGQIITMWHDEATRALIVPSFGAWLAAFAADLDAGHYAYDDECGHLVRVENL